MDFEGDSLKRPWGVLWSIDDALSIFAVSGTDEDPLFEVFTTAVAVLGLICTLLPLVVVPEFGSSILYLECLSFCFFGEMFICLIICWSI